MFVISFPILWWNERRQEGAEAFREPLFWGFGCKAYFRL